MLTNKNSIKLPQNTKYPAQRAAYYKFAVALCVVQIIYFLNPKCRFPCHVKRDRAEVPRCCLGAGEQAQVAREGCSLRCSPAPRPARSRGSQVLCRLIAGTST